MSPLSIALPVEALLQVGGLPLHPLLVHAVVVLVPLTALGALVVAVRPAWARPYSPLVALGAVGATVFAFVAREAGEALEENLGYAGEAAERIEEHGEQGLYTLISAGVTAALAVAALVLLLRVGTGSTAYRVVSWATVAAAVVATVFTFLAGDSGAESVWGFTLGG